MQEVNPLTDLLGNKKKSDTKNKIGPSHSFLKKKKCLRNRRPFLGLNLISELTTVLVSRRGEAKKATPRPIHYYITYCLLFI